MSVVDCSFDHPLRLEENAVMPMAGGIMQHGYQCGMIWGATLAAGAQAYRLYGSGPLAETAAILAGQRLVESFLTLNKHINCLEITDIDKSSSTMKMITYFLIKGGSIGCFRMAARYAQATFNEINSAYSERQIEAPSAPVSCAAMVAQKMGASDIHAVMTAGLAGGIGLCGGACGALGAVIWLTGLNSLQDGSGKLDYRNPKALQVIDRFIRCSDYEFECSEIVGRKFEDATDHAAYLHTGGCAEIIAELTAA